MDDDTHNLTHAEFLAELAAQGLEIIEDLTPGARAQFAKRRAGARKKYAESERGKAAKAAWNERSNPYKNIWKKTELGKICEQRNAVAKKAESLDKYLNRPFVAIDSEGRAPLHTIDNEGRAPLDTWEQAGRPSQYLTRDNSGNYWEDHEVSLIGAASINRPFGTPIEQGIWQAPIWIENPKNTKECFDYLLSLPEQYYEKGKPDPLFIMFSASYDWSMWCKDIYFDKAFELARQRSFAPPCKRMQGMFSGKNTQSKSDLTCISN